MINDKKIIAVCITKFQDYMMQNFMEALYNATKGTNYRIMVFNSFRDFYKNDSFDEGAKSIYKMINFDVVDILVVKEEQFFDKTIVQELIGKAKERNIPVLSLYSEKEGCFCVLKNQENSFNQILSHIIEEHKKEKIFFLAGIKGEKDSDIRLRLYKEAMEAHGLTVKNDMIAYGDYWECSVNNAIDRWVNRSMIPEAIICANDSMAITACDRLKEHGIRVPEEVLVTGFDNLPVFMFHNPRITSAGQDVEALGKLCFHMIVDAVEKKVKPYKTEEIWKMEISESCGCRKMDFSDYREYANRISMKYLDNEAHENYVMALSDNILKSMDYTQLCENLLTYIVNDSILAINSDFLMMARQESTHTEEPFTKDMVVASARNNIYEVENQEIFSIKDMYPHIEKQLDDGKMFIFQSVHVSDSVCGYYAVRTDNLTVTVHRLHRLCNVMNSAFGVIISRTRQQYLAGNMRQMENRDMLTGLWNLKGFVSYVDENYEDLSKYHIAVSVYNIPKYQFIYENYGIEEIEEVICLVAESLQLANPCNVIISRIADDSFVVMNTEHSNEEVDSALNKGIALFYELMQPHNQNKEKDYFMEVNCGCTLATPGWKNDIATLIKVANSELYLNRLKLGTGPAVKIQTAKEMYYVFESLVDGNLFQYHYQPIVSARTGQIYGYEALMRTDKNVQLSPMEILKIADEYGRSYDIEYATLNNVLEYFDKNYDLFTGKRLFVNSIPGRFLNIADKNELIRKYSHLFKDCTIEITEQNETSEEEIEQILSLSDGENACQFAIDDYGTGYSNIANLLRYKPHVIKIDHFLVNNIQNDKDKQMFVLNTIEFARRNNILTLGEGVETFEEMCKLIELGVDLLQGFYLARPSATIIPEIDHAIVDYIISQNIKFARYDNDNRIYEAKDGEVLDILELAVNKNTLIRVGNGTVRVTGKKEHTISMNIEIADNSQTTLILQDSNIKALAGATIRLGRNSRVDIVLEGDNFLHKEGISVPETAALVLRGEGNLTIMANRNNSACIGGSYSEGYGNIVIDMGGNLEVTSHGDKVVCIGGGIRGNNARIHLMRGHIKAEARAISAVGIGSVNGFSDIAIDDVNLEMSCTANEIIGIGSLEGTVSFVNNGTLKLLSEGERSTSIGVLEGGSGRVMLAGHKIEITSRGAQTASVGSYTGDVDIFCNADYLRIYGEGERISGIGNYDGKGSVHIQRGTVSVSLASANPCKIGGKETPVIIEGGNVIVDEVLPAVNRFGEELEPHEIEEDSFAMKLQSEKGIYIYQAERCPEEERFCVYLPKGMI